MFIIHVPVYQNLTYERDHNVLRLWPAG